jgi:hypothetical protein
MNQHDAVLAVLNKLRSKLGTGEDPPGSNHNFITEWYNEHVAKIGNGAWCQMTDTWSVWEAHLGFKVLLKGEAYTVYAVENAQKHLNGSSWHFGTKGMKAGDQVYYDWTGAKGPSAVSKIDHTGTVEKINGDGTFYALEGNMGDHLVRVKRDAKFVVGYVRHDWSLVVDKTPEHHAPVKETAPKPGPKPAKPIHSVPTTPQSRIKDIQRAVGMTGTAVDGKWGRATDHAVLSFRKNHLGKF